MLSPKTNGRKSISRCIINSAIVRDIVLPISNFGRSTVAAEMKRVGEMMLLLLLLLRQIMMMMTTLMC